MIYTKGTQLSMSGMGRLYSMGVHSCRPTVSASNPLRIVCMCAMHIVAPKQRPCLCNTRHWFSQFLVKYRCLDEGVCGQVRTNIMH